MKILAIGNSFSQDATRYLREIAKRGGAPMKVVNLYIGGCPLRSHYINALEDRRAYEIQLDGESFGFYASIKEALISDNWDVVTVQQASHESYDYENYQPYLDYLAAYIRKYCPKAKIYVHETWAYEEGSERLFSQGYDKAADMYRDIAQAYERAAKAIAADGVIPSGRLLRALLDAGIDKVHRDTFHASRGLGRYAIALLWYAVLTGRDVDGIDFCELDEPVSPEQIAIAKETVKKITASL